VQTPIAGIQPNDARTQMVEAYGHFEQGTGKESIMGIGGPEQEVDGQAGTATEQRMDSIASQEWSGMVGRSMS
jgi:hypothetical protein